MISRFNTSNEATPGTVASDEFSTFVFLLNTKEERERDVTFIFEKLSETRIPRRKIHDPSLATDDDSLISCCQVNQCSALSLQNRTFANRHSLKYCFRENR